MAEGHAVHGMARRVRQLVGQPGRSTGEQTDVFDPAALDGLAIIGAEAHGKHLLVHLAQHHVHQLHVPGSETSATLALGQGESVRMPGHEGSAAVPGHDESAGVPGHEGSAGVPGRGESARVPGHDESTGVSGHDESTGVSGHFHLGMHGRVSVRRHQRALGPDGLPRTDPPAPDALAWRFITGSFLLEVTRPTICELLDEDGVGALHTRLGPDPLRDDADPELAVARLHRSRRAIGLLLLDQSVVSGIGNVYRAELLWRARIDPRSPGTAVPVEALGALWQDTIDLMSIGLGAGWIVTHPEQLDAARDLLVRGEPVPRWRKRYAVYLRRGRPCPRCGTTVVSERMGLQTAYWCPGCQVLHG